MTHPSCSSHFLVTSNKQTSKQANKQTSKQANKQTKGAVQKCGHFWAGNALLVKIAPCLIDFLERYSCLFRRLGHATRLVARACR
jgi:hypothetical protein